MKKVIVGTLESGDIQIVISKNNTKNNNVNLESKFLKQYGQETLEIINNAFKQNNLIGFDIFANDQGALKPVIEARCTTAINRIKGMKK